MKLDEALLSSGRISDALQALMEWLGKAESYLTEDQPTLGDLDTVNMLLEQHKVDLLNTQRLPGVYWQLTVCDLCSYWKYTLHTTVSENLYSWGDQGGQRET